MRKSLVLLCVLLVACTAPAATRPASGCTDSEVAAYRQATIELCYHFDDALALASNTPRVALSPIIGELQAVRREVRAADVPPCADRAHAALVAYMDQVIDAYMLFIGDAADVTVRDAMQIASDLLDAYIAELDKLRADDRTGLTG